MNSCFCTVNYSRNIRKFSEKHSRNFQLLPTNCLHLEITARRLASLCFCWHTDSNFVRCSLNIAIENKKWDLFVWLSSSLILFFQFAEAILSFKSATILKENSVTSIALWILNNFSSDVFKNSCGVAALILLSHTRIQSECGKILTRKSLNTDAFHAVTILLERWTRIDRRP